jgi:hypothetical protein
VLSKIRESALTEPSVKSLEVKPKDTLADGIAVKTTENVADPPRSVVINPEVGETVKAAMSLSLLMRLTSEAVTPSKRGSELTVVVMIE